MLLITGSLFVVYLLFGIADILAQQLVGTVRSEDGGVLPGVHVRAEEPDRGAVSDEEGRYALFLPAGSYTVSFSFVGFATYETNVSVGSNETVALEVVLSPVIIKTEEVLVSEEKASELTLDSRSVSVLEPEDLAELTGQTLGEMLEQLPGVTALHTGPSISKPVVRGLHSQRVLVLNAGVSQEGQQWGGEHAPRNRSICPCPDRSGKGCRGGRVRCWRHRWCYSAGAAGAAISPR